VHEIADDVSVQASREVADIEVFGAESVLRAGDVRQFVYKLEPRAGFLNASDKSCLDLGRLEMAWKTGVGEPGRLNSYVTYALLCD
jgi:hypothetical protein